MATPNESAFKERVLPFLRSAAIAAGIIACALGYFIPAFHPYFAPILAVGVPIIALAVALAAANEQPGRLGKMAVVLALAVGIGGEGLVLSTLIRPSTLAAATLTRDAPEADLDPGDASLLAAVHGELPSAGSEGRYWIELTRDGHRELVRGRLAREVHRGRRYRRSPPSATVTVHETDVSELDLAGSGPIHARFVDVEGSLEPSLRVEMLARRTWPHVLVIAMFALVGAALFVDGAAARSGRTLHLTPGIAIGAVFGVMIAGRIDVDDLFSLAFGSALLAMLAGGAGGAIASWIVSSIAKPSTPRSTEPPPQEMAFED